MPEVRLIDANALIKRFCEDCLEGEQCDLVDCLWYYERNRIDTAPTIAAEPVKHGRWQEMGGDEPWLHGCCCSICGFTTAQDYNYCPNCGAKMDGGVEDDKRRQNPADDGR